MRTRAMMLLRYGILRVAPRETMHAHQQRRETTHAHQQRRIVRTNCTMRRGASNYPGSEEPATGTYAHARLFPSAGRVERKRKKKKKREGPFTGV